MPGMNATQQEHYERCLAQGTSASLAEMFALQEAPGCMTDAVFLQGRGGCYDQFPGQHNLGDEYARVARQQGVDISGRVYLSGLAAYPGDPEAWVSGRGDVQRVCEQRGWGCTGAVEVPLTRVAQPTGGGVVAEDIVDSRLAQVLEQMPPEEARAVDTEDLRQQVAESLKPCWAK